MRKIVIQSEREKKTNANNSNKEVCICMNTFQLECFLAVANTLSFARAAEQMNVSQPTITHQIKSLEDELDVKLFIRSTRLVEITPEGQAFIVDAKSMVGIAEQAKLRFATPSDRPIEPLAISCSSYVQLRLLTDCLNQLNSEITNFHPRLFVVPREQLFHLLDTKRADVIFDIREGRELKGDLRFKELVQSDIVCICRKDAELAKKESVSIKDLSTESLVFCDPMNVVPDIADLQWKLAEGRNPADVHFSASSEASLVLAEAGVGVAILPELYLSGQNNLMKITLEDAPKFSYGMFYRTHSGDSLLKEFIAITKSHFAEKYPNTTV